MDEFIDQLLSMKRRIEVLERQLTFKQLLFPDDGTGILRVPKHATDPTAQKGLIIFNSTSNVYKVCKDGTNWVTITTS